MPTFIIKFKIDLSLPHRREIAEKMVKQIMEDIWCPLLDNTGFFIFRNFLYSENASHGLSDSS